MRTDVTRARRRPAGAAPLVGLVVGLVVGPVVLAGCAIEKRESPVALIENEPVDTTLTSVAQLSPVPPPTTTPATTPDTPSDTTPGTTADTPAAGAPGTPADPSPGARLDTAWSVLAVIDGDILRAEPADGSSGPVSVRIVGIDAPEFGECYFAESAGGLRFFTNGQTVRLLPDATDVDAFGRALRYVVTLDGIDVGEEMVRAGFAEAITEGDFAGARSPIYELVEAEARANARGRWAPGACD